MAQTVVINLRIPSLTLRTEPLGEVRRISNDAVRFITRVELPSIPKVGDVLTLEAAPGMTFTCDVLTVNWRDNENAFVVACRYSKRTISPQEYQALLNAPQWENRPLL
jgi:hypothetical protein